MLKRSLVALAALAALSAGCGDDKKKDEGGDGASDGSDGTPHPMPDAGPPDTMGCVQTERTKPIVKNGVTLPDSLCDGDKCQVGGCDPGGDKQPACNAWLLEGKVAFQAVKVTDKGTLGLPPMPQKTDDEVCPGLMTTPKNAELNCCQRVDMQGERPAIKLTGLALSRPATFGAPAVSGSNKDAIESDRYNWVTVLESGADGMTTATTGNAQPNTDGTFTPLATKWVSSGMTFNQDGAWNAHANIPAMLSTNEDGTRTVCVGPTESNRDVVMVMWDQLPGKPESFDFPQMQLHMAGLQWELPFDAGLLCSGERGAGSFDTVGTLRGFLPVEATRKSGLYIARGASPLNLCTFIAGSVSCDGKASTWKANQ